MKKYGTLNEGLLRNKDEDWNGLVRASHECQGVQRLASQSGPWADNVKQVECCVCVHTVNPEYSKSGLLRQITALNRECYFKT